MRLYSGHPKVHMHFGTIVEGSWERGVHGAGGGGGSSGLSHYM